MPTPNPAAQRIFADCAATTQEFLATFAEDRTPAGVVRAVAGIHAYADVSIAGFQAEYRAQGGPASACQAGCAYCCHGPVHLTPLETLHIVLHLASPAVSVDERTHWGERIGQQAARIDGLTVQGQIGRTIACPFLLDDCCGIYAVRPLLCRGRNAFDAAPCRAGFADPTPPAILHAAAGADARWAVPGAGHPHRVEAPRLAR